VLALVPTGCTLGAPSFELFGAYFPLWLACALCGVLAAVIVRATLPTEVMGSALPLPWLICSGSGVVAAVLLSWLWVGY